MIDKDQVLRLAELSKLSIGEDEIEKYVEDLSLFMEAIEKIKEVDTDGVEITYNVNNMINPLRKDEIKESLPRKEVLKNTVEEQYGYFKILKVMD